MKNRIVCLFALVWLSLPTRAQENNTKVVLSTLDGLRWQELF